MSTVSLEYLGHKVSADAYLDKHNRLLYYYDLYTTFILLRHLYGVHARSPTNVVAVFTIVVLIISRYNDVSFATMQERYIGPRLAVNYSVYM